MSTGFIEFQDSKVVPIQDFSEPFQAEDSTSVKTNRLAYNIFSMIIFPIGLARLVWRGIHKLIGKLVLPAQWALAEDRYIRVRRRNLERDFNGKIVRFKTVDDVELEGMQFSASSKNAHTVILFNGNGSCYEFSEKLISFYLKKKMNVFVFNYRGVLNSGGAVSCEGTHLDGDAAVQYVKNRLKTSEKDILLHGHSLGGAIATSVAEKYPRAVLINDRSFSSLQKEIGVFIGFGVIGKILGIVAAFFGWNYDPEKDFRKSENPKIILTHEEDGMIKEEARIGECFESDAKTVKITMNKMDMHDVGMDAHNRSMRPHEFDQVFKAYARLSKIT